MMARSTSEVKAPLLRKRVLLGTATALYFASSAACRVVGATGERGEARGAGGEAEAAGPACRVVGATGERGEARGTGGKEEAAGQWAWGCGGSARLLLELPTRLLIELVELPQALDLLVVELLPERRIALLLLAAERLVLLDNRVDLEEASVRARLVRVNLLAQLRDAAAQRQQLGVLRRASLRARAHLRLQLSDALAQPVALRLHAGHAHLCLTHPRPRARMILHARHLRRRLCPSSGCLLFRCRRAATRQPRRALRRPELALELRVVRLDEEHLLLQHHARSPLVAPQLREARSMGGACLLGLPRRVGRQRVHHAQVRLAILVAQAPLVLEQAPLALRLQRQIDQLDLRLGAQRALGVKHLPCEHELPLESEHALRLVRQLVVAHHNVDER